MKLLQLLKRCAFLLDRISSGDRQLIDNAAMAVSQVYRLTNENVLTHERDADKVYLVVDLDGNLRGCYVSVQRAMAYITDWVATKKDDQATVRLDGDSIYVDNHRAYLIRQTTLRV